MVEEVTKEDVKKTVIAAKVGAELHYATDSEGNQFNADFKPANIALGAVAQVFLDQEAGKVIEGNNITALYLPADKATSDKVPDNAVDLITFIVETDRVKSDGSEYKTKDAQSKQESVTVPANLFTQEVLDAIKASAKEGSIDLHYENRKETTLKGLDREDKTQEIDGKETEIIGLNTMYRRNTETILESPLLKGELGKAAIEGISSDKLLYDAGNKHVLYVDLQSKLDEDVAKVFNQKVDTALQNSLSERIKDLESQGANITGKSQAVRESQKAVSVGVNT